ncbi:GNAT family N-acetyltransferase [Micromonospora purpureochromogenes]|uniref:GNAT family N-acetyltransferase n=1 Tax=Micromonospora purpureochromogenes TaxID=47872 RepID=UPI003624ED49
MRTTDPTTWTLMPARPADPDAAELLWRYFEEIVRRYHRRPVQSGEVEAAMVESPSDDLVPPTGLLLVAYRAGQPAGCAGLRLRPDWAELTRVFVHPAHRGHGGGAALLAGAERHARVLGADRIRLDTRADLVEARALYARHGYLEIAAYNDDVYAEHWFEKVLRELTPGVRRAK